MLDQKPARDVCLASPTRWDEACWMVPAVRALQMAGLDCGVLCPIWQADFWASLPRTVVIPYRRSDWQHQLAPRLAGQWRAAWCWEPGFAAKVIKRARIAERIGPDDPRLRTTLTQTLPGLPPGPTVHRVRHYLAAVEELGIATNDPTLFLPVRNPAGREMGAQRLLVVADSDYGPSHEWSLAAWESLLERLTEVTDIRPSIAVGCGERRLGEQLLRRVGERANALPMGQQADWFGRLDGVTQVLAVDGSIPHLAAMSGAACATWFGPNDPVWRRPLGRTHLVLRHPAECAPCLSAKCRLDHRCLSEMSAEWVWNRLNVWLVSQLG